MRARAGADASRRDWIMPGATTALGALAAFLAPMYERAFGAGLPTFTQRFLAVYPLWIVLGAIGLALVAWGEQMPLLARRPGLRGTFDALLTIASILIVAAGIIALALPALVPPEPR
jgi:hypothetical protein